MKYSRTRLFLGLSIIIAALLLSAATPLMINAPDSSHSSNTALKAGSLNINPVFGGPEPSIQTNTSTGQFHVSPTDHYNSEPAPMGITDFGYSTAGGAYKYNTTSFLGTFALNNLYTYGSSSSPYGSSVQLNLILNFTYEGNSYTYWTQDVASLTTVSSGQSVSITMIDNVWNFTSYSSPNIYPSTLSGNGTFYGSQLYYAYASSTLPGNNITLHAPVTLQLKEVSTLSGSGAPEVIMMYNDGFGWVTYDNIVFNFATNPSSDSGFVVSGYAYNNMNLYYDAEMILGGPGGGSSTTLQNGAFNFTLQYWNGHNFQYVPSAWNFGSDTAESVSNVASTYQHSTGEAILGSSVTTGAGSLGEVYTAGSVGNINASLPFISGTVLINNALYNFTGNGFNLTLYPGEYNISISSSGGGAPLEGSFTVHAGQIVQIDNASFAKKYNVNITENGLPEGVGWNITMQNGSLYNSSSHSLVIQLSNGTYTLTPGAPRGYIYDGTYINLTVHGSNVSMSIEFNRTYQVNFSETGITGLEWFLNLSGSIKSSLAGNITYTLVNGTYNYVVQSVKGYSADPSSGSITINGSPVNVTIVFSPVLYHVTLTETGLPSGYNWSVYINGIWHYSNNSTIQLELSNGTYSISIDAKNPAYTVSGFNGTVAVKGKDTALPLVFKNNFNSGVNLEYKSIFIVFLVAVSAAGAVMLRRR